MFLNMDPDSIPIIIGKSSNPNVTSRLKIKTKIKIWVTPHPHQYVSYFVGAQEA
jgi:hypothetical protein